MSESDDPEKVEMRYNATKSVDQARKLLHASPGFSNILAWGFFIILTSILLKTQLKAHWEIAKPAMRAINLILLSPLLGYLMLALKKVHSEDLLPDFELSFRSLFVGLKAIAIILLYSLPIAAGEATVYALKQGLIPRPQGLSLQLGLLLFLVIVIFMVVCLWSAVLWPLALSRFAVTDQIGRAFDLKTIYSAYKTRQKYTQNLALTLIGVPLFALAGIATLLKLPVVGNLAFMVGCCLFLVWWKVVGSIILGRTSRVLFEDLPGLKDPPIEPTPAN